VTAADDRATAREMVRCFCSYLQCYYKDNVFQAQYGSMGICIYMRQQFAGLHKPSHGLGTGTATGPGGWRWLSPGSGIRESEGAKKTSPDLLSILTDLKSAPLSKEHASNFSPTKKDEGHDPYKNEP
jgi:hypothetical protein